MTRRWLVTATLFLALAAAAGAAPPDRDAGARARIESYVKRVAHSAAPPARRIDDAVLRRLFPHRRFYVARFRVWPIRMMPPSPLKTANLFILGPAETLVMVNTVDGLEDYFKNALRPVHSGAAALRALQGWLRLSQEFSQDGYFNFRMDTGAFRAQRAHGLLRARGRVTVKPDMANRGQIDATLRFDRRGRLAGVDEKRTVKAGVRPICQATKLLDPDPVVRRMAERDLLVMGKAARPYLLEQRRKAPPALKKAIDAIWRRIQAGDR